MASLLSEKHPWGQFVHQTFAASGFGGHARHPKRNADARSVLQVSATVKVAKTLGGSQLLNIAHLPTVHSCWVSHDNCHARHSLEHQDAIAASLFPAA